MARLAICAPIVLISLAVLGLFDERQAKVDFNGTNEQRTNEMHYTYTTSADVSTRFFYDLNATLADTFVRDSIGPNDNSRDSVFFNLLEKCAITSRFRLVVPSQETEPWILQTFDSRGEKTVGGDEVYIMWKAANGDQAIAWAHDRQDGSYELEFVRPPINKIQKKRTGPAAVLGRVTLFYDYSCGIGSLAPPLKENYTRAGEVQMLFMEQDVPRPHIREIPRAQPRQGNRLKSI